jgi:hypothetical protein
MDALRQGGADAHLFTSKRNVVHREWRRGRVLKPFEHLSVARWQIFVRWIQRKTPVAPQIVHQERLREHHLSTAEHAPPASVRGDVSGDWRHVGSIRKPQATLQVSSELLHHLVRLSCLALSRRPRAEIIPHPEHPYRAGETVLSNPGIMLTSHEEELSDAPRQQAREAAPRLQKSALPGPSRLLAGSVCPCVRLGLRSV